MKHMLSPQDNEALLDILVEQVGVTKAQLTPDAKLGADFSTDSLTHMEILLAVEERFNVTIPDDRAETAVTVGDFQQLLAELLAEAQPAAQTVAAAVQPRPKGGPGWA